MRYRDPRLPSGTNLRVEYGRQVLQVELVNVSITGARLRELGRLPQGVLVTLCHFHLRYPARVVWSDGALTGVCFSQPLSTTDMNALRGAMAPAGAWGSSAHHGYRELD